MSTGAAKVFIQIESEAEQQEHLKHQRKTLKPIQGTVNDKENLTGRVSIVDQLSRLKAGVGNVVATPKYGKRKCVDTTTATPTISVTSTPQHDAQTQTEPESSVKDDADRPITADDLTSTNEPGENYYKRLAEQRRAVLEETLIENRHLHERIEGLEDEMATMQKQLDESKSLIDVLKEIIDEDKSEEEENDAEDDDDAVPV